MNGPDLDWLPHDDALFVVVCFRRYSNFFQPLHRSDFSLAIVRFAFARWLYGSNWHCSASYNMTVVRWQRP